MYCSGWTIRIAVIVMFLVCTTPSRSQGPTPATGSGANRAQEQSGTRRVPFTISKETTYIVEPLDLDGYPDYVAALNHRYGQGVTPQNNAAVPYWYAMGPARLPCDDDQRGRYLAGLGITRLPENGDCFVNTSRFAERLAEKMRESGQTVDKSYADAFYDEVKTAARRPWSKQEFPRVAAWLAANEKALELLVEASNRPRRFDPLPNGKWITWFNTQEISPFRNSFHRGLVDRNYAVQALAVRAMLRLNGGSVDSAWMDLLACHRLAGLFAGGPSLNEYVAALQLQELTWHAEQGMLESSRLSAAQITTMREDLDRLPAIPSVVEKIDIGNRFEYLHSVCWMSRNLLPSLVATPEQQALLRSLGIKPGDIADWDVLFHQGNASIDNVVAYIRKSTPAQRELLDREARLKSQHAAAETREDITLLRDILSQAEKNSDPQGIPKVTASAVALRRKALSERLADFLCGAILTPACRARDLEDRGRMRFELTQLAFALASYRADQGAFPPSLTDLSPKYIAAVPTDIFIDSKLHYSLQAGGCLLYSVGPNRVDDGGKGAEDRSDIKDGFSLCDDIAVHLSAASTKKIP